MSSEHAPVVVVGAAGALGSVVCRLLVGAGRAVVAADLDVGLLADLSDACGGGLTTVQLDAGVHDDVAGCFALLGATYGSLSGLVNLQAISGRGQLGELTHERWERILRVNVTSVFSCCQAALPLLLADGGGVIVNLASVAGLRETPGSLAYATSKAGVVMFTRTLAADLARTGVRVHAVCPTAIDSPMVRANVPAGTMEEYAQSQPMGRMLTLDEVARVTADLVLAPFPHTPEPLVV